MPVSWDIVGTLANGEIWPVLTDVQTEHHARLIVSLCELAAIAPEVMRALNTMPRQKLNGTYADTYDLADALERVAITLHRPATVLAHRLSATPVTTA